MKTPMQDFIDSVGYMAQGLDADELYDYFMEKATQMLEKEKEAIKDAYESGQTSFWSDDMGLMGDWYYNETFNTK